MWYEVCSGLKSRNTHGGTSDPSRNGRRDIARPTCHWLMEKIRKEQVMDEMAILIIWFSLIIGGMILTMFIPHIFPDAPNSRRQYDRVAPVQSRDERQEHRALVGEMGEAA